MTEESKKNPFAKWYATNKDKFNEQRRNRYKADKELRKKISARNSGYRSRNGGSEEQAIYRTYRKLKVQVFRISHVAEMCNRDEQSIRIWEGKGYIPPPSFPDCTHRVYMQFQVDLLVEFSNLMTEVRYKPSIRKEAIEKKSKEIHALWAGV